MLCDDVFKSEARRLEIEISFDFCIDLLVSMFDIVILLDII